MGWTFRTRKSARVPRLMAFFSMSRTLISQKAATNMTKAGEVSSGNADSVLDSDDPSVYAVTTKAAGPAGSLPLTDEMLREWPSGDLFGLAQNAGMGWTPAEVARDPYLDPEHAGRPARARRPADRARVSHGPLGDRLLVRRGGRGAETPRRSAVRGDGLGPLRRPNAGHGRHDGQPAVSQRRCHRLPPLDPLAAAAQGRAGNRHLRQGPAGDDDGAGGVEAPRRRAGARRRDSAARATAKTPARSNRSAPRYAHGELSLLEAAELGCRACAQPGRRLPVPRDGRDRRRSSPRRWASRFRMRRWLPPASRSGATWPDDRPGRWSTWLPSGLTLGDILTDAAVRNAMVVHAAFGGSTNLLLHIPAIAFAAGLRRPTVDDWHEINVKVPRLVSVLPNGPFYHPDRPGLSSQAESPRSCCTCGRWTCSTSRS